MKLSVWIYGASEQGTTRYLRLRGETLILELGPGMKLFGLGSRRFQAGTSVSDWVWHETFGFGFRRLRAGRPKLECWIWVLA